MVPPPGRFCSPFRRGSAAEGTLLRRHVSATLQARHARVADHSLRVVRHSGVETAGVGTRVGEKQGGTVYGEKDGLAAEQ